MINIKISIAAFSKVLLLTCALLSASAQAERKQITYSSANPATQWRLENYPGDSIAVWGTSSTCSGGLLTFQDNFSKADRNRFYATLMTAKASNVTMFVYYDENPGTCVIVSFGLN